MLNQISPKPIPVVVSIDFVESGVRNSQRIWAYRSWVS